MSLINQMLQDLDKRQAGPGATADLPAAVHVAPGNSSRGRYWLWGGTAAMAVMAAAGYAIYARVPAEAVAVQAAVPAVAAPPERPSASQPVAAVVPLPPAPQAAPPAAVLEPERRLPPAPAAMPAAVNAPVQPAAPSKMAAPAAAPVAPAKPAGNIEKLVRPQTAAERAEQYYRDAVVQLNQGHPAEGVERLKKALGEDPTHVGARQLLVRALLEEGTFDEVRQVLLDGMQQPGTLRWAGLLARLELERGDLALARRAIDFALPQAGENADFQALAGAVAQRQGRPSEAADFYRAALRLAPADGRWWIGLGLALEAEGHAAEAREAFRRARSAGNLNEDLAAFAERHSRDR